MCFDDLFFENECSFETYEYSSCHCNIKMIESLKGGNRAGYSAETNKLKVCSIRTVAFGHCVLV